VSPSACSIGSRGFRSIDHPPRFAPSRVVLHGVGFAPLSTTLRRSPELAALRGYGAPSQTTKRLRTPSCDRRYSTNSRGIASDSFPQSHGVKRSRRTPLCPGHPGRWRPGARCRLHIRLRNLDNSHSSAAAPPQRLPSRPRNPQNSRMPVTRAMLIATCRAASQRFCDAAVSFRSIWRTA